MEYIKNEAIKLLDNLPIDVSWDDKIYEMYVKKKIDEGIKAAENGQLISHEDVREKFLGK